MPTRTKPHNTYVHGEWLANCDVCDFQFHASDLRKRWDGLYVCRDDYETRHPLDFIRGIPDDPSVAWTRPESNKATIDTNGDIGKTLFKTTNTTVQEWNTELTNDRVVILDVNSATIGDQFIIYKTLDDDNSLTFVSTLRDSGTTV